jgi:NADPH:quinone reductase-like Zn-dependent oxidoreductase
MAPFINNLTLHSVNLIAVLKHDTARMSRIMHAVMGMFNRCLLKRITPLMSFPFEDVEKAFRLMQTGQHIGKIVLSLENDSKGPVSDAVWRGQCH